MALTDPVKIYAATSNAEAQIICKLLLSSEIDAFAGEDTSPVGWWLLGTLPGVFDAGVFVSRVDAERAVEVIREKERREANRARAVGEEVEARCEECGQSSRFPEAQRGSVQTCRHCGALLDVGEIDGIEGWEESANADGDAPVDDS